MADRYGTTTLAEIEERLTKFGKELGVEVICAQTNYEGTSSSDPSRGRWKGRGEGERERTVGRSRQGKFERNFLNVVLEFDEEAKEQS